MSDASAHRTSSYLHTTGDLAPALAVQRFDQLLLAYLGACGPVRAEHDQLLLDLCAVATSSESRPWAPLRSVPGVLRGAYSIPLARVLLEPDVWSTQCTQVGLRLVSGIAGEAYFRAGFVVLTDLSAALIEQQPPSRVKASRGSALMRRRPAVPRPAPARSPWIT